MSGLSGDLVRGVFSDGEGFSSSMKTAPFSASRADDITASIILETKRMALFCISGRESGRIGNLGLLIR